MIFNWVIFIFIIIGFSWLYVNWKRDREIKKAVKECQEQLLIYQHDIENKKIKKRYENENIH